MDDVTWYALGLMLTGIGLFFSYRTYQKKGIAAGMRGAGWSLLPVGLALTDTLKLAGEFAEDFSRWVANFVFSPVVWLGLSLIGVSFVLLVVSGWLGGRGEESAPEGPKPPKQKQLPGSSGKQPAAPVDDDMADIEAILRKHGIQ